METEFQRLRTFEAASPRLPCNQERCTLFFSSLVFRRLKRSFPRNVDSMLPLRAAKVLMKGSKTRCRLYEYKCIMLDDFWDSFVSDILLTSSRYLTEFYGSFERTSRWIKLGHPVQFPSRLIVPSPARLSATPWASEKRATDSRKEPLSTEGTTVEETTGERKEADGGWPREEGQEGSQKMWGRRFGRP